MKFTKHQKQILKYINEGKIYNISSYLKIFHLRTLIRYDKDHIKSLFENDTLPKTYYYPSNIPPRPSTVFSEKDFLEQIQNNKISADNYSKLTINLTYSTGILTQTIDDIPFILNFYEGVYIASDFEKIIEFLSLWQYLKSEMLILDAPYEPTHEDISIFFTECPSPTPTSVDIKDRIKTIDFSNNTYSDSFYLGSKICCFSEDLFNNCKEFWNRRIYKTPKLTLFIQKGFCTSEERMQNHALFVAWLAIFVSVILTFVPSKNDSFENIENSIAQIETHLNNIENSVATLPALQKNFSDLEYHFSLMEKRTTNPDILDCISTMLNNLFHKISDN